MSGSSLHVVGGTYIERCSEPHWDELFGSGLRAAAAVSLLARDVALSTYIGADHVDDLAVYADTFGLKVSPSITKTTIRFTYEHPLSTPGIAPPLHLLTQEKPLCISGQGVLRFGMLEGTAIVDGGRVVYDPQSTYAPELFGANGSRAAELAIVANSYEAQKLSGETSADTAGITLLGTPAEVVIVKGGARGLTIFTRDEKSGIQRHWLPAFITPTVFPIGSGDVFSAVFAHGWTVLRLDPITAAERASKAVAFYCATKRLPIPPDPEADLGYRLNPLRPPTIGRPPLVYLAGPFFTAAQRWLVRESRDALQAQGVDVFSPFHDVGIGAAEEVVPKDIEALDRCHAVLAIVDGTDAGTLFEIGHARAKGVAVVALAESVPEESLKMLRGTGCEVHMDFTSAIYRAAWAAMRASRSSEAELANEPAASVTVN